MKLLLAALAASTLAGAAQPPLNPSDLSRLLDVKPDGPGCAVAIVDNGQVSFASGYGLADLATKRPIAADTTFNIASMTKQFTAMAIALLIEDGKLSEQDDVRKFLPELKNYGAPIRVANLLNHSSGLRNHMALAAFQPGDHLPSHQEALKLVFRQSALNFAPGTRHQYESPNYVLLAELVSRASGMSYEEFLATRIFHPLGMSSTGFSSPALARAYAPTKEGGWKLQEKTNGARGSSGLLSNVADFAKWMINYDRLQVGGAPALEKMLSTSKLSDGSPLSYRYGLSKEFDYSGVKGLTRISHGGQTAAFRSAFSYFPGKGVGDVVMCNFTADAQGIDLKLLSSLMSRLKPPQPASVGGSAVAQGMPVQLPAHIAGTYYSAADDNIREFVVKDGGLALKLFGEEFPLRFVAGRTFAVDGQPGEFRFSPPDKKGAVALTEAFPDQAALRFALIPPTPKQPLGQFTGTYRSADVDGLVTIQANGDMIQLRFPAGEATLRPFAKDRFTGQEYDFNSVIFHRDQRGKVDGLTLSVSSGITRLRFRRVAR